MAFWGTNALSNEEIIPGFDDEACDYLHIALQRVEGSSRCLAVELSGSIDAYNSNFLRRNPHPKVMEIFKLRLHR